MRFLMLVVSVIFCSVVYANPPQSMDIKLADGKLEVFVSHPVSDPATHYIKKITVTLNDKELISQAFITQKQPGQYAVFLIPGLKSRDKLTIKAFCSRSGDASGEVVIE